MMVVAVTEKAADPTKNLFRNALKNLKSMFVTPRVFFTTPTFAFVCVVYGGTYITANSLTTACEFANKDPFWVKLGGTTAVNMVLGVLKDRYFAQKFSGKPVTRFPLASWGLFVLRDTLTIGAGFMFPPMVSSVLMKNKVFDNKDKALDAAQLLVPLSAQIVLTPIHLLALDFYNNKLARAAERVSTLRLIFMESFTIRIGRTICAYSIAGVMNKNLKKELRATFL